MTRTASIRGPRPGATRRKIRRNIRGIFVILLTAVFCVAGSFAFYQYINDSSYFLVKFVKVDGTHVLNANDVAAVAGISNQDNILFLSMDSIRQNVLALPYVQSCRVTRIFPDVVSIAVVERVPVATLVAHGHLYELDSELTVLRRLDERDAHPGPLVTQVPNLGAIEPGRHLEHEALREALDAFQAFQAVAEAGHLTVSELSVRAPNDIRMYCDELNYEIRWGRGDYATQAARLDVLWSQRGTNLECREYLDLRFGKDLACL